MRYAYPYELAPQPEGGFTVTFPDVPEAITQGDSKEEAAALAEDALITALSFYTDHAEPLPRPSPARGRPLALRMGCRRRAAGMARRPTGKTPGSLREMLEPLRSETQRNSIPPAVRLRS